MSRKVRDSSLETRTARSRLKISNKPYYRLISSGVHVGYRKLANGPGTWVARHYKGRGKYTVRNIITANNRVVVADDFADADGCDILNFAQAQDAAREPLSNPTSPLTVKAAIEAYLQSKADDGRDIADSRSRAFAHIIPTLGEIECERLTTKQIKAWHRNLAKTLPLVRSRPGALQKFRKIAGDPDAARRRQASANRVLTILKAALNDAFNAGKLVTDIEWRRVKPFPGADASRLRYLKIEEAERLINAASPSFRALVQAALVTGARYGQLAELTVCDFNPDAGTLRLRSRKGDGTEKVFHATLTYEGAAFFKEQCFGKATNKLIFQNNNREWRESEQTRPMMQACKKANLHPPIGFHGLRHTWASLAVMNEVPLLVVAKNMGHSDTRMVEKHYGHLDPGYVQKAIRAGAPVFGFRPSSAVR